MILKAPTGLFSRRIPQSPTDSGSVTYTISNQEPPPPPVVQIVQAPPSVVLGSTPVPTSNRDDFGDLIYTVVHGKRSATGSGKKAFEAGDIISFEQDADVSSSIPTNQLTIQHNTNLLDFSDMGLTEEEVAQITTEAEETSERKRNQVISLQTEIGDIRIKIRENQKNINECSKAVKAVAITFDGSTSGDDILDKLNVKVDDLEAERDALNAELTSKSLELQQVQDDLIDISQVVR